VSKVGFQPKVVELVNVFGNCFSKWSTAFDDDTMLKTVDSGADTVDVSLASSGGITATASGFTLGADSDLNRAGEFVYYKAIGDGDGPFACGTFEGVASGVDIGKIGFKPRAVEIHGGGMRWLWIEGMGLDFARGLSPASAASIAGKNHGLILTDGAGAGDADILYGSYFGGNFVMNSTGFTGGDNGGFATGTVYHFEAWG
jgi:hypothetical protein